MKSKENFLLSHLRAIVEKAINIERERSKEIIAKKIKSDSYTKSNREKSNIGKMNK